MKLFKAMTKLLDQAYYIARNGKTMRNALGPDRLTTMNNSKYREEDGRLYKQHANYINKRVALLSSLQNK